MDAHADGSSQSRWDRVWLLSPYLAVAVAAPSAALREPAPLTLALSALVVGWHWWMVTAHPGWPERRAVPMTLYFTVLLGLAGALYVRDSVYFVLLAACYPTAFVTLPGRLAYVGVVATSAALAVPSALGADWWALPGPLASACGSTVLVCAVGGALRAVEAEARRRRLAYDELAAAHARMSELARTNAGLQDELLERARESGVLTERTRMARELHDTLAQGLAGILTHLEAADGHVPPEHPARGHVDVARRAARENLAEARRWMLALRPAPLDDGTLAETLAAVVERWRTDNGARATVTATGAPVRLRPDAEETILRATQEALANVARHARAGQVRVTLSFMDDVVALDVLDDGVGFDPDAPSGASEHGGFGLSAMRHRVTRVAGTLTVESAPGRGTALSVTVPALRPEADEADEEERR